MARRHERVAPRRRDFWRKVTRWLVDTYGAIVLEDLNPSFMLRNTNLSRTARDTALGVFTQLPIYRGEDVTV